MSYIVAKSAKALLDKALDDASAELQKFDQFKGVMGMTPDHIKASPEFRKAKHAFDVAFQTSRNFNGDFNKRYKKEIAADRRERYNQTN